MKYQRALLKFPNCQWRSCFFALKACEVQREIWEGWSVPVASQPGCASAEMELQQLVQNLHLGENGWLVCECDLFWGEWKRAWRRSRVKGNKTLSEKKKEGKNAKGESGELYWVG